MEANHRLKEINCRTTLLMRNYILQYHPEIYEPFIGICGENGIDEAYLSNENHWVSFEFVNKLYDLMYKHTQDPFIMFHVGLRTDELIPTTLPVILFKAFRSPHFAFKQCTRFAYLFEKISKVRVLDMGRNYAVIEEEFETYRQTWHSCQYGRGIYAKIPDSTGKELVSAEMLECSVPIYQIPGLSDQYKLDGDYVINKEGRRIAHKDDHMRFRGTLFNSKNDVHKIIWRNKRKMFPVIDRGQDKLEEIFKRLEKDVMELEEKADLMMELDLAGRVQKFFFPKEAPTSDEWDVDYSFKPMTAVSGDIYDFYVFEDRLRGVGVFDVTGHGISAGLITMLAKSIIYRNFRVGLADDKLGNVMRDIAMEIIQEIRLVEHFLTGVILRLNGPVAEYVNAGHHEIIVYSKEDKSFREITDPEGNSVRGSILGLEESREPYQSATFRCGPGDIVVLFTDGIVEQRNPLNVEFGVDRLRDSIKSAAVHGAGAVVDRIVKDLAAFTHDSAHYNDDCTLIVLVKK